MLVRTLSCIFLVPSSGLYITNKNRQMLIRKQRCTKHSSNVPQFDLVQLSEDTIRTRGNNYKLIQHHYYYDLRK